MTNPWQNKGGDPKFREQLDSYCNDFEDYLMQSVTKRTAHKHSCVTSLLIDYLHWDCSVSSFSEITRGMVCSSFRRWYASKVADLSETEINTSVKKFFSYLVNERGVEVGKDILVGLKIKVVS
jgi:hypothetical protein